jgi:hypothetical protein
MMTERLPEYDDRRVDKNLRKEIWDKSGGKCWCCETQIKNNKNGWDAGHLISRANHGPTEIANLEAMCKKCNGEMGTKNAVEYKRNNYSQRVEVEVEEEEEVEEVVEPIIVNRIIFNGINYLKAKRTGIIYDEKQNEIGIWNIESSQIDFITPLNIL